MSKFKFVTFEAKRFRSLISVKVNISDSLPVVICGENNIGKTNFLRAMNLFFNHLHDDGLFVGSEDIPHHIYHARGGSSKSTELIGTFQSDSEKKVISITFKEHEEPTYKINNAKVEKPEVESILKDFKYFFIESNNINVPLLMSEVLEDQGLMSLDKKRQKQSRPLEKLNEFIDLSKEAINDIERDINKCFEKLTDFDGILKDKKIKIHFAEFERLRDAVKGMTEITLFDGNNNGIAQKGSGAQRAVFISLMQYVAENTKKSVVWGIDEPEVFLQPKLQKKLFHVIQDIVSDKKQPTIISSHSQHFISLKNLEHTHLFTGSIEEKEYARRPGQKWYETSTKKVDFSSEFEKSTKIKEHLGIDNNDGWEVLPYNLVVEGEEDKRYLEALFDSISKPAPNIIWSGGASKIAGYLQYYEIFAKDLDYKPKFICIFDNDNEGRSHFSKIKPCKYKQLDVETKILIRHDGQSSHGNSIDWEIEDLLPQDELIQVINKILKQNSYKKVRDRQINERSMEANKNTQILEYLETCISQNNPDKEKFSLNDEGRKKQICKLFCESVENGLELTLNSEQISFLKAISP